MYSNAKLGDKAYVLKEVYLGAFCNVKRAREHTISRVTPTQVHIDGARFRKSDGRQVGGPIRLCDPITLAHPFDSRRTLVVTTEDEDRALRKTYNRFELTMKAAKGVFGNTDSTKVRAEFFKHFEVEGDTLLDDMNKFLDHFEALTGDMK